MYPVTIDYLNAIQQSNRASRITGLITLADDSTISVTNDIIAAGSLYVSEQSVSGDDLDIGSVYVSEMGIGLISDMENPYALDGARINLQYGLLVGEDAWEYVPLGTFYVYDIQRNKNYVSLKAYDGMILFDIPVAQMSGNPYNLIHNACGMAGVPLGMIQSDFAQFPNYDMVLTVSADDKIKTCRDLVMWVCQLLGAFARVNRIGQLEIMKHGGDGSVARTISVGERVLGGTKISDFEVQITEVTMKVGETEYSQGIAGTTMKLSANPLLADKAGSEINAALANVLGAITQVQYIPFDAEITGDPAIQPGDYIALENTVSGVTVQTGETLTFNGTYDAKILSCVIEGRSEQDNDPSPENPQPVVNAGNCNLISRNVDDTDSTSVAIPTLRGVADVADTLEYLGGGNWLHTQYLDPDLDNRTEESIYDAYEDYILADPIETVLNLGELDTFSRQTIVEQDGDISGAAMASAWTTGGASATLNTLITHSVWRYRGKHAVSGKGKAARLRSEYSQIQKAIEAVTSTANEARSMATAAQLGTELLNSAIGGNILIRQESEGRNEILIMDSTNKDAAVKMWRYNINGWGYSDNCVGADNPERAYTVMATMDGALYATQVVAAIGTFIHLIAGDESGARQEMGVDESGNPYHTFYDGDGNEKISVVKEGVLFDEGTRLTGYTTRTGKRSGVAIFIS